MGKFIDTSDGKATFVNNGDWLLALNYVEFLRDIGPHFSVNKMLSAECYKQRLEKGLSFLEFNYMLMQSYDFYELFNRYGCNLQCGGDDQWSNMLGGTELIRRKLGKDAYALTITLLCDSNGNKMGKTAGNAVWLDAEKTSPYDFFQYWRNVGDADVIKCIKMLTFLPLEQISEMESWEGAQLNRAKEILAYELTKLVHGKEEAEKALGAARSLFGAGNASEDMPTTELSAEDFTDGKISVIGMMLKSKLASSGRDARTLISQGGIALCDEKVTDMTASVSVEDFDGKDIVIKKGKKIHHRFVLNK
jgi:tyrosyl-tRNA synthetase